MTTRDDIQQAWAKHAHRHRPFKGPRFESWDFHCPHCGAGANVARVCDSCGIAVPVKVEDPERKQNVHSTKDMKP